jgi:ABC-type polysaccharide/polyol phosphate transport system ATPase subunit
LIGANGAGKSTLLRTVAGVYRPDEGWLKVNGRVAPILSLSAGLKAGLSGWENIALSGVLLGVKKSRLKEVTPEIASFSGLGDFLDAPVRVYSAGMKARLGFAIAAFADADIMVLDEILSVGDQNFTQRSRNKIIEILRSGRTVLTSSHSLDLMTDLCDRLVWLDKGRIVEIGSPSSVVAHYLSSGSTQSKMTSSLAEEDRAVEPITSVSVVIAAYNESEHIRECLDSLGKQTFHPHEVIVVDDGSRDGTPEIVASTDGVMLMRQDHKGAGSARNLGGFAATGQVLVFVDADMTFAPDFIERLIAPIVEKGAVGTFTREIFVANPRRRWARAHMIGRGLPAGSHFPPGFPDRWENFRAITRSAFVSVNGFDEIGHGEDVTLGRKLQAQAEVAPGAVCWHYEPDTLSEIWRSAKWYGRGERVMEGRPFAVYNPLAAVARAWRLAIRHGTPSLFAYRLVWDSGVLTGLLTRGRHSSAK